MKAGNWKPTRASAHRSDLSEVPYLLWRFKGTILIQVVIITIGLLTRNQGPVEHRQLVAQIGMDYRLLRQGRVWQLLTGTWFQSAAGINLSMIVMVLAGTVVFEYFAGTVRMLITVVSADWIATILTAFTIRVWSNLGSEQAIKLLHKPDSGTSALAHAGMAAAAVLLPPRWRATAILIVVVYTTSQFWFESPSAVIAHCWATVYGLLIGWYILRSRSPAAACEHAARQE